MNWKSMPPRPLNHVFAWFPVKTVCGHIAWLEYVELRSHILGDSFHLLSPNPEQRRKAAFDKLDWC